MRQPPRYPHGRIVDRRTTYGAPERVRTALEMLTPDLEDTRDPVPPPIPTRARAALLPPPPPTQVSAARKQALLRYLSLLYRTALTRRDVAPRRSGR